MNRKFTASVICMGLAFAIAWPFYRNYRLERDVDSLQIGASELQVVRILGKPSWHEPCGQSFGGLGTVQHCTEFLYRTSFAPLIPEDWSVRLDDSRHVIQTYRYDSP